MFRPYALFEASSSFLERHATPASRFLHQRNARHGLGVSSRASRGTQDNAFTTMSSRSSTSARQTSSVLSESPRPPRARELSGTVVSSASRRRHRSLDRAHRITRRSESRPSRHVRPASVTPYMSIEPQSANPCAHRSTMTPVSRRVTSARMATNSQATKRAAQFSSSNKPSAISRIVAVGSSLCTAV